MTTFYHSGTPSRTHLLGMEISLIFPFSGVGNRQCPTVATTLPSDNSQMCQNAGKWVKSRKFTKMVNKRVQKVSKNGHFRVVNIRLSRCLCRTSENDRWSRKMGPGKSLNFGKIHCFGEISHFSCPRPLLSVGVECQKYKIYIHPYGE